MSPRRRAAAGLARDHQALARLVHHAHVRNLLRHGARLIGAGIVDDQDFVGHARLREEGMEAGGEGYRASLWAQTMTLILQRHACAGAPTTLPWYTHVHMPQPRAAM